MFAFSTKDWAVAGMFDLDARNVSFEQNVARLFAPPERKITSPILVGVCQRALGCIGMRGSKMKMVKPEILILTGIVVLLCFIFWFMMLFLDYVADDLNARPADERSVPTARAY